MHNKLCVLLAILVLVAFATVHASKEKGEGKSNGKKDSKKQKTPHPSEFEEYDYDDEELEGPFLLNPKSILGAPAEQPTPTLPSPSYAFSKDPQLAEGSSCNALIDTQYPIFSDMCGSLPQARYSLPNIFGHNDRWQLGQILTTLMSSTTDPKCIRSLRHLLCPMLFQPCRARSEPPVVLPCQYFCRAVKVQCGSLPALDLIPCEGLPYASDYCPDIQLQAPPTPSQSGFLQNPQQPESSTSGDKTPTPRSNLPEAPKPQVPTSVQPPADNGQKPQQPTINNDQNRPTSPHTHAAHVRTSTGQEYNIPTKFVPSGFPNTIPFPNPAAGMYGRPNVRYPTLPDAQIPKTQ